MSFSRAAMLGVLSPLMAYPALAHVTTGSLVGAPLTPKEPGCTQCGAPHEQHITACVYCLTPRGGQHKAPPIAPQPAPCWRWE